MKRTRIDFAPPSLRRTLFRAPPQAAYLVPAILALCIPALVTAQRYLERQEELDALQAALAARGAAAAPAPAAAPAAPKVAVTPAQANAVNAAVMQLNLPWRDLAAALSEATPPSVALLALEPDARRRTVRITAETRGSDDMLAYVARLQAEAWFSSVALVRHEIVEQDPNRPLRFQVSVQWEAR